MRFRKKPVVIEAFQWSGKDQVEGPKWFMEALQKEWATEGSVRIDAFASGLSMQIFTLEGIVIAQPGDYIIKGVKGELYSCKPDIFEAIYVPEVTEDLRETNRIEEE